MNKSRYRYAIYDPIELVHHAEQGSKHKNDVQRGDKGRPEMVDPILICVTADRDTQFDPYSYHYYRPEDYLVKSGITNYALPYTSRSLRVRYQFATSFRPSLW